MSTSENRSSYGQVLATSLRHVIVNWLTLKPLFRVLFQFKTVLSVIIAISIIDLIDAVLSLMPSVDGDVVTRMGIRWGLDSITDHVFSRALNVVSGMMWVALGFILYRHLKRSYGVTGLEDLTAAKKKGLISDSEFRVKALDVECEQALQNLRTLHAKGVFTREEYRDMYALTRRRFKELTLLESLRLAKASGVINNSEYKERVARMAVKPDEDLEQVAIAAIGTIVGKAKVEKEEEEPAASSS